MAARTKPARAAAVGSGPGPEKVVTPESVSADTILYGRPSAWALRHAATDTRRTAPGAPRVEPRWATAAKDGVGMALCPTADSTSLVWFTLGRGILTETFYPRVDHACTRDPGLIVTDNDALFSDEQTDADHRVEHPIEGVPLYRLVSTCRATMT